VLAANSGFFLAGCPNLRRRPGSDVPDSAAREVIEHYEAGAKGALLLEYRCRAKGCQQQTRTGR
jgi:hypothetical protein